MPDSAIGASLPRLEDARLLTGAGCYSDDFTLPGQAYAWVVRSPYPHVRIVAVDTSAARAMPGVLLVLTGADVAADGLKPVPHIPAAMSPPDIKLPNIDGSPHRVVRPDVLAIETACFVGEGVAFVVAETLAIAKDAAEAVQVDYAEVPPLADVVVESLVGDPAGTQAAFAQARHVVKLRTEIQRVTGVPMEPRAALGHFEPGSGRYTLYAGGGAIVRPKKEIAIILGIEPEQVRVIAKEVGGNFGTRNFFYPEFALVCWAARRIGRPVKWTCERHEAFLSDYAGRDFLIESELALDADGSFLGLRATSTSNLGAYTASFVPLTKGTQLMTSLYRMPAMARARGVLSNTPSTAPYRSAGRPEAMFVIERLIDLAARAHGFDRIALRRRNLITTTPHTNAFGVTYDSGDYVSTFDEVLKLADWSGFARRQAETEARGLRRGIGLGGY
ncbi:MAG TPA: molybdopterin cofactor-binding domain-containing protein, partial [Reyranella sp.]|nr:molybdopterin cofactor-binding domain-containing protein [Reyranella sp.]